MSVQWRERLGCWAVSVTSLSPRVVSDELHGEAAEARAPAGDARAVAAQGA